MLPVSYLELIISVFHCLKSDNWCVVVAAVNVRMFLIKNIFGFPGL